MNIFALDNNVEICAEYHNNSHVVKMILESAQMLSNAYYGMSDSVFVDRPSKTLVTSNGEYYNYPRDKFYKIFNKKHPCSLWTLESYDNWMWLLELSFALCYQYMIRYGKIHSTYYILEWMAYNVPIGLQKTGSISKFALAMPDDCKFDDSILSYRYYYFKYKKHIAKWSVVNLPFWYNDEYFMDKLEKYGEGIYHVK